MIYAFTTTNYSLQCSFITLKQTYRLIFTLDSTCHIFCFQRPHIFETMRFMVETLFPVVKDKFTDKVGLDLEGTEEIEKLWRDIKKSGYKKPHINANAV